MTIVWSIGMTLKEYIAIGAYLLYIVGMEVRDIIFWKQLHWIGIDMWNVFGSDFRQNYKKFVDKHIL